MTIYVINPNASELMTEQLRVENENLAIGFSVAFEYCVDSPASIEGHSDGVKAAACLLDKIEAIEASNKASAYVIACFDDTGLDAARELTHKPVIGIGQAAMMGASLLCRQFCIITAMKRSVPILKRNAELYGFSQQCAGIFAANLPVLALKQDPQAYEKVLAVARVQLQACQGEALVLGCAGLSQWSERLSADLQMPVIDGVKLAIKFSQSLVDLKLETSKINAYAFPEIK